MTRQHALVLLLFFLTKPIIFSNFFFPNSLYHGLLVSTHNFINFMKSCHASIFFFVFNTVIISILVCSSKPSERDDDQLLSLPVSFPPAYEEVDDDSEEELSSGESDHEDGESHGFLVLVSVSSLVYEVEDKEEASDYHHKESDDYDEDEDSGNEYHGFDGYEEDNEDGEFSEDEVDSDVDEEEEKRDLERRIQEFIDKVYKQWGEELYNERFLCLPPPQSQFKAPEQLTYISTNPASSRQLARISTDSISSRELRGT